MYTLENLPLFNQETSHFNIENVPQTTESIKIIENLPPKTSPTVSSENINNKHESIIALVNKFFPDCKNEKDNEHIKKIISSLLNQYADEELQTVLTEIQYLCESILEEYERKIFKGKSLNELLNNLF